MSGQILVLGSGKMALDIGGYLLARGGTVTLVTSTEARLPVLIHNAQKMKKRVEKMAPDREVSLDATWSGGLGTVGPPARIVIETTKESLEKKRSALTGVSPLIDGQTLVVSNSSSILPDAIDQRCVGIHFFYPVALTEMVELIYPGKAVPEVKQRALGFLNEFGIRYIVETEESAHMMNRLLLPVQAEAMRDLALGIDPRVVDACTASSLLPVGQLTLLDAIGLDLAAEAIDNYLGRKDIFPDGELRPLIDGLRRLTRAGKLGLKCKDGFMVGQGSPPPHGGWARGDETKLRNKYLYLFMNTCFKCIEQGLLSEEDLNELLSSAMLSERSLGEALAREGKENVEQLLMDLYRSYGYSYFAPSRLLSRDNQAVERR